MQHLISPVTVARIFLVTVLFFLPNTWAAPVNISGPFGTFSMHAKSLKEIKWDGVIRQQYDYSCGSAAVATLLTYHYDLPVSETMVYQSMWDRGNQEKIRTVGFSMLDMKHYMDSKGLRADGFTMSIDAFIKVGVPGIALLDTQGFKHFVVVKGLERGMVLVGDPASGTVVVPKEYFNDIWNGTILAAREEVEIARANFNNDRDWRVRPAAPISLGVNRTGIATGLLELPGANEMGR